MRAVVFAAVFCLVLISCGKAPAPEPDIAAPAAITAPDLKALNPLEYLHFKQMEAEWIFYHDPHGNH